MTAAAVAPCRPLYCTDSSRFLLLSVGLELSSIDKSGVLSSGVTREEWSKTQLAAPAQPAEGAEGEQAAAPQKVVNELQAIQTPREIQDSLWDTLPPVQHKRGRPIDNIRRKVGSPGARRNLQRPVDSGRRRRPKPFPSRRRRTVGFVGIDRHGFAASDALGAILAVALTHLSAPPGAPARHRI